MLRKILLIVSLGNLLIGMAVADSSAEDMANLSKQVQNPVANMIVLPFQNNTYFDFGPNDRTQNVMNVQPVIPVHVTSNWNVIIRNILPLVHQPNIEAPGYINGRGNINPTFFLSPANPGKVIWGVGPTFYLPTSTNSQIAPQKWAAGPSAVVLAMPGKWVVGALVNNLWSVAGGSGQQQIDQMTFQYFLSYNLPKGWYLSSAPIITANWEAKPKERWVVPFGLGAGRVFMVGHQAMNMSMQYFYNVKNPDVLGPKWSIRTVIEWMFPES